jgi:hypothetical protein
MAAENQFAVQTRALGGPCQNACPNDFEQRLLDMLRAGNVTGTAPNTLLQIGLQLPNYRAPRHWALRMLAYPLILMVVSVASVIAMPRILARQLTGASSAKTAVAETARSDNEALVLNATSIMGDKRLAIINGRTYGPKDAIVTSSDKAAPCVVVDILPSKVLLECQGKRRQLRFVDNSPPTYAMSPPAKPIEKQSLPPECSPTEKQDINLLLEKALKGELGVSDLLPLLTSAAGKKE